MTVEDSHRPAWPASSAPGVLQGFSGSSSSPAAAHGGPSLEDDIGRMDAALALGPQVLIRWSVEGKWTTKWHVVEPGLAIGNAHSRMLCGMLRQPGYDASELAISSWPFETASGYLRQGSAPEGYSDTVKNPDVCGGCRYEIEKQRAAAETWRAAFLTRAEEQGIPVVKTA